MGHLVFIIYVLHLPTLILMIGNLIPPTIIRVVIET